MNHRRARLVAISCVLIGFAAGTPSAATGVHGESRDLGIRFVVASGTHWCRPEVDVHLTADSAAKFRIDTVPFLDMLGRIRAVLASECPVVERITYIGLVKGHTEFAAATSHLTGWHRLIAEDPSTRRPLCPDPADVKCPARAEAYVVARDLMRGAPFSDVMITNTMGPDSNDLAFRDGDVIGKLRIAPRDRYAKAFPTPDAFAQAIAAGIADACRKQGGGTETPPDPEPTPQLGRSMTVCQPKEGAAVHSFVLVWNTEGTYRVFSLLGLGPTRKDVADLADRLTVAIRHGTRHSKESVSRR
jgi:hypothetical protein